MPKISFNAPYRITHGNIIQPLTDTEGKMIWAFIFEDGITTQQLAEITWGEGWNWPETYAKCIHVKMWKLRIKLARFGWTISNCPPGAHNPATGLRYLEKI